MPLKLNLKFLSIFDEDKPS